MPSLKLFLTKYIFRCLHMASFGLIFGDLIFNHCWGRRIIQKIDRKSYNIFYISTCVILMTSGLINMIILIKENKFLKNSFYKIWKNILIIKFFLTLSLTPLLEKIIPQSLVNEPTAPDTKNSYFKIRLIVVLFLFLMSPFLRFFREYYLTKTQVIATSSNDVHKIQNPAGKINID